MIIRVRDRIWSYLKKKFCQPSPNQVIPMMIINGHDYNDQEADTGIETTEVLSLITMHLSMLAYFINYGIALIWSDFDSNITRVLVTLSTIALTHISWFIISHQLRTFAWTLVSKMTSWTHDSIPELQSRGSEEAVGPVASSRPVIQLSYI